MSMSVTCPLSAAAPFRNLRRAGVLKNRSRTSTVVPALPAAARTSVMRPPSLRISWATASPQRDRMRERLTLPMLASASPRKPIVATAVSSASSRSLLVACWAKASGSSPGGIPPPSSITRISDRPPSSISTVIRCAPASRAFSTSSLTTLAGRSMTSPAAMRLTRSGGSCWMVRRITCTSYRDRPFERSRVSLATAGGRGLAGDLEGHLAEHLREDRAVGLGLAQVGGGAGNGVGGLRAGGLHFIAQAGGLVEKLLAQVAVALLAGVVGALE